MDAAADLIGSDLISKAVTGDDESLLNGWGIDTAQSGAVVLNTVTGILGFLGLAGGFLR